MDRSPEMDMLNTDCLVLSQRQLLPLGKGQVVWVQNYLEVNQHTLCAHLSWTSHVPPVLRLITDVPQMYADVVKILWFGH
jgi:hypothetical protein